jgi:hypothetical protein
MRWLLAAIAAALLLAAPASPAPPSAFPGTKSTQDRAEWRAILHWPRKCERDWARGREPVSGIVLSPTATVRWLVEVTCTQGAYQGEQLLYLVDRGLHAEGPLVLRAYRDLGKGKPRPVREARILGTLDFNPGTGRLVVLDKFRGAGDCGIYSVFQLHKDRFIPRAVRAKLNCNGKGPFNPTRWPLLPRPKP